MQPVAFHISAPGLALIQDESGAVTASGKDGRTIFTLPAPAALVEDEAVPGSAYAVLTQAAAGEWTWTCHVNAEFAAKAELPAAD